MNPLFCRHIAVPVAQLHMKPVQGPTPIDENASSRACQPDAPPPEAHPRILFNARRLKPIEYPRVGDIHPFECGTF